MKTSRKIAKHRGALLLTLGFTGAAVGVGVADARSRPDPPIRNEGGIVLYDNVSRRQVSMTRAQLERLHSDRRRELSSIGDNRPQQYFLSGGKVSSVPLREERSIVVDSSGSTAETVRLDAAE